MEGRNSMARKNNSKQTIENIISISAKLFIEKGYDKTSMQDIVNALGMSKGAIFHHFHSKEEIFHSVIERQSDQIVEAVNLWLIQMHGLTAKEKLRGVIKRNLQALTEDKVLTESNEMVGQATGSPHLVLAFMQEIVNKLAPVIADVLREGAKDGSIDTEFPNECAEVFLLLLNFWCDTDVFPGSPSVIHKRFLFLQYLMKKIGVDIVEDEMIALIVDFYGKKG